MKRFVIPTLLVALGGAWTLALTLAPAALAAQEEHKVAICHGTASAKNPYVLIIVDESAKNGHFDGTAPGHGKNNAPDFALNGGNVLSLEEIASLRAQGNDACGCPTPVDPPSVS